jgi:hypothetical protein
MFAFVKYISLIIDTTGNKDRSNKAAGSFASAGVDDRAGNPEADPFPSQRLVLKKFVQEASDLRTIVFSADLPKK